MPHIFKMELISRGELFLKIVEAYSRPTRIVRGKDFDANVEVIILYTCRIFFFLLMLGG